MTDPGRRRVDVGLLAACSIVYLTIATRAGTGVMRTQFDNRAYSQFFDLQGEALLRGDLALPPNSIGLEAFVVDGQEHMYFGLFPAFLRLPLVAVTDRWFGQSTVISTFLAWLVFVIAAWAIIDRVVMAGEGRRARVVVSIAKVSLALGTPVVMLAGPAWVFSEAIMWGVAATVLVQWRLLVELAEPSTTNEALLGAALVLVALNRPTLAAGCLLVTLAVAARRTRFDRRSAARLAAWTTGSAVVLVVPNLLRFGRPLGPPMEQQVLSQVDPVRMEMLAYAGGDFVDPRYSPTTLLAYLRPDGVSFSGRFPFVGPPEDPPTVLLDAVFDITYRTPSLVATSTLLVAVGLLGAVGCAREYRSDPTARRVVLAAAAGVPAAAVLVVWGFIAPRYLADFVPLLVPLFAFGTMGLVRSASSTDRARWVVLGLVSVAAWSIVANGAIAVSASFLTGPDGGADRLVAIQGRSDYWTSEATSRRDDAVDFAFERSDPPSPDTIAVLGSCQAAYLSSGEPVDPWLSLGYGDASFRRTFEVRVPSAPTTGSVLLAEFSAIPPNADGEPTRFDLRLVVEPSGEVRLDLADEFGVVTYPLDVTAGERIELTVTSDPVRRSMFFDVDGTTAHFGHVLTRSLFDEGGQRVDFTDGGAAGGLVVIGLEAEPADC